MELKPCKRCQDPFRPTTGNSVVCVVCRPKWMKEEKSRMKHISQMRKHPEAPYNHRGWEGRMKMAQEVRAEYIASYFLRNGVLLKW